jgi:P27 family predicted phage terminase small subunit
VNYEAPVARQRAPRAPADMNAEAKAVWRHVMREMAPNVILAVDEYALRAYCEAVVRYRVAQRVYERSQPILQTRNGIVKNPMAQVVRDSDDAHRAWARELGLTPAARAGMRMDSSLAPAGIAAEIGLPPRLRSLG